MNLDQLTSKNFSFTVLKAIPKTREGVIMLFYTEEEAKFHMAVYGPDEEEDEEEWDDEEDEDEDDEDFEDDEEDDEE